MELRVELSPIFPGGEAWNQAIRHRRNYFFPGQPKWRDFVPDGGIRAEIQHPLGILARDEQGAEISLLFKQVKLYSHEVTLCLANEHGDTRGCLLQALRMMERDWGIDTVHTYAVSGEALVAELVDSGWREVATLREHVWYQDSYYDVKFLSWRGSGARDEEVSP